MAISKNNEKEQSNITVQKPVAIALPQSAEVDESAAYTESFRLGRAVESARLQGYQDAVNQVRAEYAARQPRMAEPSKGGAEALEATREKLRAETAAMFEAAE